MKLNPIKNNMNELIIGDVTILFSYQTPVAFHVAGEGYYRTDQYYSKTTSRHINDWLKMNGASMDKVITIEGIAFTLHMNKVLQGNKC